MWAAEIPDALKIYYDSAYFKKQWADKSESPEVGYADYFGLMPIDFVWQQALLKLFADLPHGSLLDLGCANGRFLALAEEIGFQALGVEIADAAVNVATKMGLQVLKGSVEDQLPFHDDQFDVITAWELLEHVVDLRHLLSNCYQWLKPGGLIFFSTPDAGSAIAKIKGDQWIGFRSSLEHVLYLTRSFVQVAFSEIFGTAPIVFSFTYGGDYSTLFGFCRKGGARPSDFERASWIQAGSFTSGNLGVEEYAEPIAQVYHQFRQVEALELVQCALKGKDSEHMRSIIHGLLHYTRGEISEALADLKAAGESSRSDSPVWQWLSKANEAMTSALTSSIVEKDRHIGRLDAIIADLRQALATADSERVVLLSDLEIQRAESEERAQQMRDQAEGLDFLSSTNNRLSQEISLLREESAAEALCLREESSAEIQRLREESAAEALCLREESSAEIQRLHQEVSARDRLITGICAGRIWRMATPIFKLHHLAQRAFSRNGSLDRKPKALIETAHQPDESSSILTGDVEISPTGDVEISPTGDVEISPTGDVEISNAVVCDVTAATTMIPHLPDRYDVICFSILEWDFAFQRPHQMASGFAEAGHRVFYMSLVRNCPPEEPAKFLVRELRERIYEVHLAEHRGTNVYGQVLAEDRVQAVLESIEELRLAHKIESPVMLVQLPFWTPLAIELRKRHGWKIVYDCMDEWDGFPGWDEQTVGNEKRLVEECDLLLVSSQKLWEKWSDKKGSGCLLIRNAANFDHFRKVQPNRLLEKIKRPIVGYFGAIADWFDLELMKYLARSRPDYSFVLLGWTSNVDMGQLEAFPNVHFLGQKSYQELPDYLYHFDACIIPFLVNHITEAVDPVKFYEYVSLGKPVVAPRMPELYQYKDLLYIAEDHEDFLKKVDAALAETDLALAHRRVELASQNTWQARLRSVDEGIKRIHGRVTIIVVTYDNIEYTRLCLESVLRNSLWPDQEIILVDNASADGTRTYLRHMERSVDNLRVILNSENLGFAKANNQGLAAATGNYLVLLNNDVIAPNGWLPRLLFHLDRDPRIGLVGPVTNFSGNETKIDVSYNGTEDIENFALEWTASHQGRTFEIAMLPMHCVAFRRSVFEQVGFLDERFEVGMFEDDDYSRRVQDAGYRVVCAEDVFVHHFGRSSFGKLPASEYQEIFNRNRQRFEDKWGSRWAAHQHRITSNQA